MNLSRLEGDGLAWRWPLLVVLWLEPSIGQLLKVLGPRLAIAVVVLAAVGIGVLLLWLRRPAPGRRRWWPLIAIAVALVAAFAALYPMAHGGRFGGGSDRGDALDVAGAALLSGTAPYQTHTFSGNPVTPLPGAVLMALPFHLLGAASLQNLLWFPLVVFAAPLVLKAERAAVAYLLALVAGCPAVLQDFVTGGDYATNALYVALAVFAAAEWLPKARRRLGLAICVFVALAVSSRPIYAVELPIVTGALWRRAGPRAAVTFMAVTGALILALNLPFYLADPAHFPLFLHKMRLAYYPAWLHVGITFPALALAIGMAAFAVDTRGPRIFLLSALALAPLILPDVVHVVLVSGASPASLAEANYGVPISLFAGLWLLAAGSAETASGVSAPRTPARASPGSS